MTLQGKAAIVTGSDSGIGRAIALELARQGAAVTINYHKNEDAANATKKEIEDAGGRAQIVQADVSSVADIQRLVDATVSGFGQLDILVNNAGMETRTSTLDTTEHQFDLVIAIDLKSAFFGVQLAAKQMIKQGGGGRIINISSIHEDWPMPGNSPYCAAKGGVRMLTRTAGVELAPHGITVVGVAPGAVHTPIDEVTLSDPVAKAKLESAIPLGRVAEPSEIANLVAFLASDGASYGTAATYTVDDPTIITLTDNGDGTAEAAATGTLGTANVHVDATADGVTVSGDLQIVVVAGDAERVAIVAGAPEEVTPDV